MNKKLLNVWVLTGSMLFITQQSVANTYGLVIGIDAYKSYNSLDGAVNDAKMVAASLEAIGAKVTLLTDDKATRSEIMKAWADITAKAKAGDTVYFTYAGHGAQLPERLQGTEADGQDEFYVLTNFEESGINNSERLMDDDLLEWFNARPDLHIISVSDSCHSGTMTRAYKRVKLKYRRVSVRAIIDDKLPLAKNLDIVNEQKNQMAHVVAIAGVPDDKEVPEVFIEKTPHGALSWHFSKGMSGLADVNQDGEVSVSELKNYLIEKVRMQTEGQQQPQITYVNDMVLKEKSQNKSQTASILAGLTENFSTLPFSVEQRVNNETLANSILEKLTGIDIVSAEKSLLEWDIADGVIRNQFNDLVYQLPRSENTTKAYKRGQANKSGDLETIQRFQAVINKFRLIEQLKLASDGSLELSLLPTGDKLHKKGDPVALQVNKLKYPYFTLINLAVDGTINFLYPSLPEDTLQIPVNQPYKLDLEVSEPFGADHFVVIVSDKPLTNLHTMLKKLDNSASSLDELRKVLSNELKDSHFQIGIHASFTAD